MSTATRARKHKAVAKREKRSVLAQGPGVVVHPAGPIRERLAQMLDLPPDIVSLIFDTVYDTGNGIMEPLFKSDGIEIPFTEIQEIVRVYDIYRGLHTDTGRELDIAEQADIKGEDGPDSEVRGLVTASNIPDTGNHDSKQRGTDPGSEDVARAKFEHYIKTLVKKKETKVKKNLLIRDDSVFETPLLENLRQEERIKINLSTRKKKPVKGILCGRCKNDEVHVEERIIRAGDEGGVMFYKCDTCDHEWRVG